MLNNKTIAVVVPAYNEERQINLVIDTMPDFVDRIVVVNDCSKDKTADIIKNYIHLDKSSNSPDTNSYKQLSELPPPVRIKKVQSVQSDQELIFFNPHVVVNEQHETDRIILINHTRNGGVGATIATGYKWCKDYNIDCTAVMAGDAQMNPAELIKICQPVVNDSVDYVKGNRLIHRSAWLVIPKVRYFGNSILSILTKIASGYWRVSDTQTGYTAMSNEALNAIRLHEIYRYYGMPNDMLVKLNIAMCTLREVGIKPVYDVGEQSKMRILEVIPRISWLLFKSFFKRLWIKYFFRDFHPLFLLYNTGIIMGILFIPYLYKVGKALITGLNVSFETLFAFTFLGISSFISILFAMWMDIQDNERLYK